ncbi:MAG: ZIP family metal transporter [Granulosicoccaceae bacterium]|jgi:zinc and cadmium transporter
MSLLGLIIIFSLVGGLASVILASTFLLLHETSRSRLIPHLVSFAIGALLGAAFLALLPHALLGPGVRDLHDITLTVLLGILAFFLLEKLVLWRHCHHSECEVHGAEDEHAGTHVASHHAPAAGTLILIGDTMHNLVDGVLIAAAFLTDEHLGIVTAIAVATHEIPQELGDFSILLHSGYSRARALLYNILSSLATLIGAVAAYYAMSDVQHIVPYVLAIAAASFIYIAVADLIPGLHERTAARDSLKQIVLILAGVVVIYIAHSTLH